MRFWQLQKNLKTDIILVHRLLNRALKFRLQVRVFKFKVSNMTLSSKSHFTSGVKNNELMNSSPLDLFKFIKIFKLVVTLPNAITLVQIFPTAARKAYLKLS